MIGDLGQALRIALRSIWQKFTIQPTLMFPPLRNGHYNVSTQDAGLDFVCLANCEIFACEKHKSN